VEKLCTSREAPDENMSHVHCMLVNLEYKHNLNYVIFIAFPLQILLEERTRTQTNPEEVEMKKTVHMQSPYYSNLHYVNDYTYS
jgi:hypothetical protein